MKITPVAILLLFLASCSSNTNGHKNDDSTSVPGNSAGAITISSDSARMDTSLGRIMTDSAR